MLIVLFKYLSWMLQIVLEIIVNNFLFVMQGRLMFLYHLIFHIFIGDKTMADKLMYISPMMEHKITSSVYYN